MIIVIVYYGKKIEIKVIKATMCKTGTSGNLLYSAGSSAQCSVVTKMGGKEEGGRSEREGIYVYI